MRMNLRRAWATLRYGIAAAVRYAWEDLREPAIKLDGPEITQYRDQLIAQFENHAAVWRKVNER